LRGSCSWQDEDQINGRIALVSDILSTVFQYLPGFVLGWIFSKRWLAEHTTLNVGSRNEPVEPVTIFCGDFPYLQLTLNVTNRCYKEVELDRLTVEFTFPGITQQLYYLRRTAIPRRKTVDIIIRGNLSSEQAAAIAKQGESSIKIEVFAEFNCDIQDFSVNTAWPLTVKPRLASI
jgi:hypothetical protein